MAEAASEITPERKRSTKERGIDDYKRKIWKLKKELEEQRELSLAIQKEELEKQEKRLQLEREKALDELKLETRNDLLQMKATVEAKEAELQAIIKRQENEIKVHKKQIVAHAEEVKGVREAIQSAHQDNVSKLQRELKQLKHLNQELQQKYQTKQQDYRDKAAELKSYQDEAEAERQKLLNDALTVKLNRVKRDQDVTGSPGKDRDLQHKVTELTVALKRYEKRCDSLKEENTNLRRTEASYRDLEEQCAKLKRRNADLTSNVKSASEKNKQLQVSKKSADAGDVGQGVDHAKKLFARQRAKDFADHAKALLTKDKEIERLTKKNVGLSESINNAARSLTVTHQLDMSTALRQGTKERMALELKSLGSAQDDSEYRATIFNLQADYDTLNDKYELKSEEKDKLEQELEEFRSRLGEIEQELGKSHKGQMTLQEKCEAKDKKFVQLTALNNTVVKERDHLTDTVDKLTEEIAVLKHEKKESQRAMDKLKASNKELKLALDDKDKKEFEHLESNITHLTEQLQTARSQLAEKSLAITQLEAEAALSEDRINELLDKNQEVKGQLKDLNYSVLPNMEEQAEELRRSIRQLELKNEDLMEEKQELLSQCDKQEDLVSEIESAKLKYLTLTEQLDETQELLDRERKLTVRVKAEQEMRLEELTAQLQQTNEERQELEENRAEAQRRIEVLKQGFKTVLQEKESEIEELVQREAELKSSVAEYTSQLSQVISKLADAEKEVSVLQADLSRELNTHTTEQESFERLNQKLNTTATQLEDVETSKLRLETALKDEQKSKANLELKVTELEENCENKLNQLEELTEVLKNRELTIDTCSSTAEALHQTVTTLENEKERISSEQERLKELLAQKDTEKENLTCQIGKLACDLESLQSSHLEMSNLANTKHSEYESTRQALQELQITNSNLETSLNKSKQSLADSKKQETLAKKKLISLKQDLTSSYEQKLTDLNESLKCSSECNRDLESRISTLTDQLEEENANQISVYAGENCYYLYVARHVYDPSISNGSLSPVKSGDRSGADSALSATERMPDVSVNPGDYVFVSGGLTEEGYYEGHLLDGRAGLIPSTVLEPLYEFDIYGFVVASEPLNDADESAGVLSEFSSTMFNDSNWLPSTPRPLAPYPKNLALDRQFSSGILVGWDCPEGQENVFVYRVYVDGKFRASLNGRSKCKALVEGVKSKEAHRVCVTATTSLGESDRRHCTIVIGEPNRPPSLLDAIAINSETIRISFLPHNSNHHHTILINGEKVRSLSPSLFQVDIAGILPSTEYCITATASPQLDQSLTSKTAGKNSLSVSMQFTMPSAEKLMDISDGQMEPEFLEKFDKFLDVVTNKSASTISGLQQIETGLEDAEFLKAYDATLSNTQHSTSNLQLHSTPKYPTKLVSNESKIENFSPIILDLENETEDCKDNTHTINDQSTSDSTPNIGENEQTPVNGSRHSRDNTDKLSTEDSRNGKPGSMHKSRSSPLQNKHSLQRMIKSLTNKEKNRTSKTDSHETGRSATDSSPRSSHRHSNRSGEKRKKSSKHSPSAGDPDGSTKYNSSDTLRHTVDDVRSFRAVYDYEPALMSPNRDAVSEELPFQVGDLINAYGDVDADGFYLGELNGRRGYVPSNLVEELQIPPSSHEKRMTALFDYDPSTLSPNPDSDQELSFRAGETVIVADKMDEDGFYHGYVVGRRKQHGLIPSNYLQKHSST